MPAKLGDINLVFINLLRTLIPLVGIAIAAMFVVGGYQFLMAGSDKDAAARARGTLTYAVVGLILALSAWIILSLLGSFLGDANLFSNFSICLPGGC